MELAQCLSTRCTLVRTSNGELLSTGQWTEFVRSERPEHVCPWRRSSSRTHQPFIGCLLSTGPLASGLGGPSPSSRSDRPPKHLATDVLNAADRSDDPDHDGMTVPGQEGFRAPSHCRTSTDRASTLALMRRVLKTSTPPPTEIDFATLAIEGGHGRPANC
jgi:hypothetical protein